MSYTVIMCVKTVCDCLWSKPRRNSEIQIQSTSRAGGCFLKYAVIIRSNSQTWLTNYFNQITQYKNNSSIHCPIQCRAAEGLKHPPPDTGWEVRGHQPITDTIIHVHIHTCGQVRITTHLEKNADIDLHNKCSRKHLLPDLCIEYWERRKNRAAEMCRMLISRRGRIMPLPGCWSLSLYLTLPLNKNCAHVTVLPKQNHCVGGQRTAFSRAQWQM